MTPPMRACIIHMLSALAMVLPASSIALPEPPGQSPATHTGTEPLPKPLAVIPGEVKLDELSAAEHSRSLLHGCHYRRCLPVCNRCKFRNSGATVGHCRKNGFIRRCTRGRIAFTLPALAPSDYGFAPAPDPPQDPFDYEYYQVFGAGGPDDAGDEGNEGDEGDEGNEGATEYDYYNDQGEEEDVAEYRFYYDIYYMYDELAEEPAQAPMQLEPSRNRPPRTRPARSRPLRNRPVKIRTRRNRRARSTSRPARFRRVRSRRRRDRRPRSRFEFMNEGR